jgi:hypothetical protein
LFNFGIKIRAGLDPDPEAESRPFTK